MSVQWITGTSKELLAALRPGGWVMGHSALWRRHLRLHKTDLMSDLRRAEPGSTFIWRIVGDPEQTGQYAKDRRTVVVWLGK